MGCRVSDHGLEQFYKSEWTEQELKNIFEKARIGNKSTRKKWRNFNRHYFFNLPNGILKETGFSNFILGALRNNNSRMLGSLGPDTGWDSIGDFPQATALSFFPEFTGQK